MPEKYEEQAVEKEILQFWEKNKIYPKLKKKNKGKKHFYFLEGPPYTSGKVHLGTALNLALKDSIIRYKRMQGFDVFDRWGYDVHGLPTEHATEKKLGISGKKAIQEFGVNKFIDECRTLALENAAEMNKDFWRLGGWFDYENAYMALTKEYIEGEWWLVKQAHEKGRLYEGERSMSWCASCGTACAKHELEYKKVKDNSIYVKLKLKNKKDEYLIIWTTTPWTIPFNLAVMAHPDHEYVRAKVGNETWILAKALADDVIVHKAETSYTILETFPGKKLEGTSYEGVFENEIPQINTWKRECPKTYTVVLSSEYVDVVSGTGLVHCSPGCGPEDYEVGHKNKIKPFNTLNDQGIVQDIPFFEGMRAKTDDKHFIEKIKDKNALIAQAFIDHDYAHCQRCHKPIIYKTTKQWFFKVEDMKEKLIKENDKIHWTPKSAYNAFDSWLQNLRDNSITKQRYWGTPVPIWRNVNNPADYLVIGSAKELEELSGKKLKDLHKPSVDPVEIKKDGKTYKRIPDILDVWVDAGCASWNALDFPAKKEAFEKLFPADLIMEGIDQIRGWFNLLHVASMISHEKPSFKAVYMHGFINDSLGRKMSKSLGNYILPQEVIDKQGVDTLRYYMIGGANPGLDLNYNFDDLKLKYRNLMLLWNLQNYLLDFAEQLTINPKKLKYEKQKKYFDIPEQYLLSKVHSTIKKITELYDQYHLNETPLAVEELFLELSRTYIQLVREKTTTGKKEEKEAVLYVVYESFLTILKLFAPTCPFICEKIYQNVKKAWKLKEESIHHYSWPTEDSSLINEELEKHMQNTQEIIAAVLYAREKAKLGIRWPLKKLIVVTTTKQSKEAVKNLCALMQTQTNVKEIEVVSQFSQCKIIVEPQKGALGKSFGEDTPQVLKALAKTKQEEILKSLEEKGSYDLISGKEPFVLKKEHVVITKSVPEPFVLAEFKEGVVILDTSRNDELEGEGFARELARRIQDLRKKAGLVKSDGITLQIQVSERLAALLEGWHEHIKEKVGAKEMQVNSKHVFEYQHTSTEKIKEEELNIALEKRESM
ncbi:isoleucine--tRNA ligase [Candidatus Woesearchaeota archaeon]|nr:isoleucine--tRNA ligase [Candidatus Woesearchaeota archaeon]